MTFLPLRPNSLTRRFAGLLWLVTLGLAACGGAGNDGSSVGSADDPLPRSEPMESEAIGVFLTEYSIDIPTRLDAGEISLAITNQGVEDHNFIVSDPESGRVIWETDGNVQPNQTAEITFELAPGTYLAVCTFAGHDSRGMLIEIEAVAPSP